MLDASHFLIRTLLEDGLVTPADLDHAREQATRQGIPPLDAMVRLGMISTRTLAICWAKVCEHPFVDLDDFEIDLGHASLIPESVAESLLAIPLFLVDGVLTVAMRNPLDLQDVDQIRRLVEMDVDPVVCDEVPLARLVRKAYEGGAKRARQTRSRRDPLTEAIERIVEDAASEGATDIHFEPGRSTWRLRVRVRGRLEEREPPAGVALDRLVERLRTLAGGDAPDDARQTIRLSNRADAPRVRLAISATNDGDLATIRLDAPGRGPDGHRFTLPADIATWFEGPGRPGGLLLATGLSRSGRAVTIDACLDALAPGHPLVIAVGHGTDLPGVLRLSSSEAPEPDRVASQIRRAQDLDPDVLVLDDLWHASIADAATEAALSGVLVIATMHASGIRTAIERLVGFGLRAPVLADALFGVTHQNLEPARDDRGTFVIAPHVEGVRMTATLRDALRTDVAAFDRALDPPSSESRRIA